MCIVRKDLLEMLQSISWSIDLGVSPLASRKSATVSFCVVGSKSGGYRPSLGRQGVLGIDHS